MKTSSILTSVKTSVLNFFHRANLLKILKATLQGLLQVLVNLAGFGFGALFSVIFGFLPQALVLSEKRESVYALFLSKPGFCWVLMTAIPGIFWVMFYNIILPWFLDSANRRARKEFLNQPTSFAPTPPMPPKWSPWGKRKS